MTLPGKVADVLVHWPRFLDGMIMTLEMTVVSTVVGLLAGITVAAGRRSDVLLIRVLADVYVQSLRNTPFLVQILVLYFGLASLGLQLPAVFVGMLAMVINVGAYTGEIIRAGLDNIPRGQIEAAECLGLSRFRVFLHVCLAPAIERVYPALTSQFVLMMLMSSVTSQISVEEISGIAINIQSETFLSLETYVVVAVLYVVLALLLKAGFWALGEVIFKRRRVMRSQSRRFAAAMPAYELTRLTGGNG